MNPDHPGIIYYFHFIHNLALFSPPPNVFMFQKSEKGMKTPLSVYRVVRGKRYRFRLVGGLCSECPVRVKFEGHQMLVIATDGNPVVSILVDTVVLEAGR
jgi:hypothetical protein